MTNVLFGFNWIGFWLLLFTAFLVVFDRAFSKKIRIFFLAAVVCCGIMSNVSQHYTLGLYNGITDDFVRTLEALIRPAVILLLVEILDVWNKMTMFIFRVVYFFSMILVALDVQLASIIVFCGFAVVLLISLVAKMQKTDERDYLFAGVILIILFFAVSAELITDDLNIVNNSLSLMVCFYYYYFVMRIYKKDRLTGLLMRHNLVYEMADLENRQYDIVLIDVDNFKLINDKYGHDKGDEALVTVVDTVEASLPRGARMYRFGGDEFVIVSRKVNKDKLESCLENANKGLKKDDLHISYGIVTHMPGDDGNVILFNADKVMYENKRTLKSEAIWDDMTGLYNYRGFLDELDSFRNFLGRDEHILCLVGVDIDRLGSINLEYGYTEGNIVISALARVLKSNLRGRDFLGHLGSDEFVIAIECDNMGDKYIAHYLDSITDGIESAYELADKNYSIKLNIGTYYVENDDDTSSEEYVNRVLYTKQEDKDNRRKNDTNEKSQEYNNQDEKLVMDIIDNNKLKYAFQPIVSAKDGSIVAYESLMRSDTETMVSPLKILKYAEHNKKSYEVEKLTFFNVLEQISQEGVFPADARIFINSIPGYLLTDDDYDQLIQKYGNLFERLVMEITEQREVDDTALVTLNTRREKDGFNLAIDDYGSGCSNTNSLLRYMPQIVKLDRLLITGIDRNAKKQFFVNSIISFARENDMLILAEGVETERELKTVIRLGVDMIQGYITAKPDFEIITKIPDEIRKVIIDENLKVGSNQRMIYTASSSCELSVMHLAMEDYSKINVSGEFVTITGSTEYTADMVIKVKDGVNCHMTLKDVQLNSVDAEPCIELGENTNLVLNLEGNNRINSKGILVPEGSSIKVIGSGNLDVHVKGHECYAVGTDSESGFGAITFNNSGNIEFNIDGEQCVGIGGGVAGSNSSIDILSGHIDFTVAGVNAVAIGCYKGCVPINIVDCTMSSNFRVNQGIIIGCLEGEQDIKIKNYDINFAGSGTEITGIGSYNETSGKISLDAGTYISKLNGHIINLLGCKSGPLSIEYTHSSINLTGEGDNVMGLGSTDNTASIDIHDCSLCLVINASSPIGVGAKDKSFANIGPATDIRINGDVWDLDDL